MSPNDNMNLNESATGTPIVSIIMAAHNAEKYIGESIQSILNQTFNNWELIIVNDCSEDKTVEIINSFSDKRIHTHNLKKNLGAGEARNVGLKLAKGNYIAFLDADDIWLPTKLDEQLFFMRKNNAPICHTSYSFMDETGLKLNGFVKASPKIDLHKYMRTTEIGLSTAVIDRSKVGTFSFNPMRLRQDTRLWIDLFSRNLHSNGLDKELVNYRVRGGQISGNKWNSAYRTLKLYLSLKHIPLVLRLYNFSCYLLNAIFKRIARKG